MWCSAITANVAHGTVRPQSHCKSQWPQSIAPSMPQCVVHHARVRPALGPQARQTRGVEFVLEPRHGLQWGPKQAGCGAVCALGICHPTPLPWGVAHRACRAPSTIAVGRLAWAQLASHPVWAQPATRSGPSQPPGLEPASHPVWTQLAIWSGPSQPSGLVPSIDPSGPKPVFYLMFMCYACHA